MQANGISPVLLAAPKTIIQRKSTATPRPRNSLPSLFNSQDTPSLLGLFLWGFNENWWTGSLSKKIHISREESSIHVTVTKSWQNVFFKYEEWSLSEWHENANPSTWKQQGDNERVSCFQISWKVTCSSTVFRFVWNALFHQLRQGLCEMFTIWCLYIIII